VRVHRPEELQNRSVVRQAPAGREPISFTRAVSLAPVARWFSSCKERSTALASASANSSIRALSSERRSTLARAWAGIEFTLDPPSMVPKLKDERGRFHWMRAGTGP